MKLNEINVTKKEFVLLVKIARKISVDEHQGILGKGILGIIRNNIGYAAVMKDGSICASYDIEKMLGVKTSDSVIVGVNRNEDEKFLGNSGYDRSIKYLNSFAKAVVMVERPIWIRDEPSMQLHEELKISGKTLNLINRQGINIPIIYANGAGTKYFIFKNSESAVFKFEEENI